MAVKCESEALACEMICKIGFNTTFGASSLEIKFHDHKSKSKLKWNWLETAALKIWTPIIYSSFESESTFHKIHKLWNITIMVPSCLESDLHAKWKLNLSSNINTLHWICKNPVVVKPWMVYFQNTGKIAC